ncbi:MAG: cyclic-di-AMP receptor [Clostridia bacterium]|nr:cyclic-di-AMP receptor [Clostridia bacterium]
MKLIVAIVQDEDAGRVVTALMDQGFSVTKLATTGGFLRAGNTTLISGVEDDKLDTALGVIEKICKSREQITASTAPMGSTAAGGVYVPYPIRVTVGGATIFVLEVSQFLKV